MIKKLIGTKQERDELTTALRAAPHVDRDDDPRHIASQRRICKAEKNLPPLGRLIARDRSR